MGLVNITLQLPGINDPYIPALTTNHVHNLGGSNYLQQLWTDTTENDSIFSDTRSTYKLNEPNPILQQQPQYHSKQSSPISDIISDTDSDPDIDILNIQCDETDYLQYDDDIMIDNEEEHYPNDTNDDYHQLNPPPISNIFRNHPHYNTNNRSYQSAMNIYIQKHMPHCLIDNTKPNKIKIPMNVVKIQIKCPDNPNKIIEVDAAADSQSDIEAIGINAIIHYKQLGVIKRDPKGITIGTGNGPVHVYNYVPITVISKIGKLYTRKFWCLESLPTHDFLLGSGLCDRLGWEYKNRYETWEHKPTNLDHIESELDDLSCSNYPWKGEPDIDIDAVHVENDYLRPFIHKQLQEHKAIIAKHEWDSGRILDIPPFDISFIQEKHPYKEGFISKEYWTNQHERSEVTRQLGGMIDNKLIEEITGTAKYISPIFCVAKKTGDVRIVFDYRKLNEITEKHVWKIPDTDKLFAKFKGKQFITSLDLKGGYWHIPIKKEDQHKTAFIFDNKVYQWKVLPFGPTNAPMYFQQCMEKIFGHLDYVTIYLDDISILSDSLEEHKEHLKVIFELLKYHNIKLRLDKCLWGVSETEYLGFIVDKWGTKCKAAYVKKILDIPIPKTKTELKRFLGLINFLHKYLPQLHNYVAILTKLLLKDKTTKIEMNDIQLDAFNKLKEMVRSTKPLAHPDINKPFHVFTDASMHGLGGMLAQQDEDGDFHPVAYCSKVFTDTQSRWHVSEQELYAAIYCVEKWSDLLRHQKFTLHTDHKNLQKLFNSAVNFRSGKLFRWAVRLQDYHFECKYIKGSDNVVADYLSRESVLVQTQSEYFTIKRFYNNTPQTITTNTIRQFYSENGGVDIHKLYINHLHLTILNDNTEGHYLTNSDPYTLLLNDIDNIELTPSIISSSTHTNISINSDINSDITDNMSLSSSIAYLSQQNINKLLDEPQYKLYPLKHTDIDSISSLTTESEEHKTTSPSPKVPYTTTEVLERLPSPKPYQQPTPQKHGSKSEQHQRKLRRSKRLRNAHNQIAQLEKARYEPLHVDGIRPFTTKQLQTPRVQQHRQKHRKTIKEHNETLIDKKPGEYTWNKDLLINTKYDIPIQNDYSNLFDETNHIKTNLIRIKQWMDAICFAIINFLDTGSKTLINDLPKYIRRYVLSGRFVLDNAKVLCFKHTRSQIPLRVVPAPLLTSVLSYAHSAIHHGKTKMEHIIVNQMKYWWPKMREHIKIYCKCCNTCQHNKPGVWKMYSRGNIKLFTATEPFEQISTDIVGPLPMSQSGNRYIVTMIDKFSRYCMLVPVPDVTALSVIKAIDRWITTFGPPKSILSDNGPQFISNIYRDYLDNHKNIKYRYTSTYHPQCNGQIERLHRWIKERLTLISYDGGLNFVNGEDDWADYLGIIQYTYNSTPNLATTYSPMDIVIGRNDYELKDYVHDPTDKSEYARYMTDRQRIIKADVAQKQAKYDKIRKEKHEQDIDEEQLKAYEIGQKVLWNINSQFHGNKQNKHKLGPKWIGPYEIVQIFNEYQNYRLRVIPIPPLSKDNVPNNKIKIPRRAGTLSRNIHDIQEFNVPRAQIKPYYESYEEQFDGTQSPIKICINKLSQPIHQNNTPNINIIQKYQTLFHIQHQQLKNGYINNPYYQY